MYGFSWDRHKSDRMCFGFPLLIVFIGSAITTVRCLPEITNRTDLHLNCFIDLSDLISCAFESEECSEHSVTLKNTFEGEKQCVPTRCSPHGAQCCCSIAIQTILGESHEVSVLRGGRVEESKHVSVKENIKPKTPNITSVYPSNGIFQVKWKSNTEGVVGDGLTAEVTIRKKKGGEEKVFSGVKSKTSDELNTFDIPAGAVESSSTYLVRVRSFYSYSGRFSDSSEEFEFTTPASHSSLLVALIASLSVVAAVIAAAIFYCYLKVKKIWDNCPYPKVHIHPYEREFLKPELSITSSVSIASLFPYDGKSWTKEALSDSHSGNMEHSSGFSTGSSCLSYATADIPDFAACQHQALRRALANVSPVSPPPHPSNPAAAGLSPAPCGLTAADTGRFNFENKVYSLVNPIFPPPMTTGSSEAPTQMACVSEYHPVEGDATPGPDHAAPAFPTLLFSSTASSWLSTDMSYQPCGADSGLSSGSSGIGATPTCHPADEGAGEAAASEAAANCGDEPRRGLSAPSCFPPVEDSYQSFQSLVSQPVPEMEERLDQHPAEQSPDSLSRVPSGQRLPEPQRDFFSLLSADKPPAGFTDSGYERV